MIFCKDSSFFGSQTLPNHQKGVSLNGGISPISHPKRWWFLVGKTLPLGLLGFHYHHFRKLPERRLAPLGRQRFSKSLPKCSGAAKEGGFGVTGFFVATKKHMKSHALKVILVNFAMGVWEWIGWMCCGITYICLYLYIYDMWFLFVVSAVSSYMLKELIEGWWLTRSGSSTYNHQLTNFKPLSFLTCRRVNSLESNGLQQWW